VTQTQRDISKKLGVLTPARETGNISKTCRYFGISRTSFYEWKGAYKQFVEGSLINGKPCPENVTLRISPATGGFGNSPCVYKTGQSEA
jgi:hypothetical protein